MTIIITVLVLNRMIKQQTPLLHLYIEDSLTSTLHRKDTIILAMLLRISGSVLNAESSV